MKTYEELLAERDAFAAAVAVLREYIERGSPVNINPEKCERRKLLARAPQQCLAEIKAEAGRAGFIACAEWVGDSEYEVSHMLKTADEYAAKIRNTGTWLKDSNVNGGKRQGGEK